MIEQEALALVQSAIPEEKESLYTMDRDASDVVAFRVGKRSRFIKRYYVGCGQHMFGNGDTWEEAVDAFMISAEQAKKAKK
jgi:hypothetical protein